MIRCAAYRCLLSISACLARQEATNFDKTGVKKHCCPAFPECARCQTGAKLRAATLDADRIVARFRRAARIRVQRNLRARSAARAVRWGRPEEAR